MSIKITEEGKTLLEDAILQDKKVVFSQIELIADVEKSPTEMVKRVDVSKVSASNYNTITVQAQIDNDGFLDTYYFNRANVYADEVLFAYDDGINICIPAETTKVINDLEMMMKIDSAVADLKIIYEGYVLRKDFDDMESKIQKINTTIKDMEANAVTQNDCTDQVSWNSQIVKKEFLTIGNMAFFRATGGFSTSRGSIVLATIPQGYFPETTGNQSSYELMGVFTSAYDKERRNCYVTLNCLSGNVDLQINNNEAYSDTRADDNVQMIFYGFWKMNTESQGGTGGSISYREDIEKLRQSIQDSKKEIVKSGREIDSLKNDLDNANGILLDSVFVESKNRYNKATSIIGTINTQGVVTKNDSSAFLVSDFILFKSGITYEMSYFNTNYNKQYMFTPNRLVCFDLNKLFLYQTTNVPNMEQNDYISYATGTNENGETYRAITPKQDLYVRFQINKNFTQIMVQIGTDMIYEEYFKDYKVKSLKEKIVAKENLTQELQEKIDSIDSFQTEIDKIPVLENKVTPMLETYAFNSIYSKIHRNVLFIGDSLTEGYQYTDKIYKDKSYPAFLSRMCNWTCDNRGQSGITTLGWWNNQGQKIDFTPYDAIFIYLGTNGGLTDTIDTDTASGDYNTFAKTNTGGYCAIVAKIRDVNPNCKIYIVKYGNTTISNITQVIADKYNCDVITVMDTTYFTLSDSKYHTDLTHYNTLGYYCFALNVLWQVEKIIKSKLDSYTAN